MVAYRVLRAVARLALRWFYRDIEVVGIERVPRSGPVLMASNHPNALVDALVIASTLRRKVTLTAKATLLDHPVTRPILRLLGVVPLRRTSDDAARNPGTPPDPSRNAAAFSAVLDALEQGGMVLVFPEGKSHSDPALAPLRTGLARIALMARDERGLCPIPIVPLGLTFEQKSQPRSRVVVHVGSPILVGDDVPNTPVSVTTLTQRIDYELRGVTLNFSTADEAARIIALSRLLAQITDDFRPLHTPDPPLAHIVELAKRVGTIDLSTVPTDVRARIQQFLARLQAVEHAAHRDGIALNDIHMSTQPLAGTWFAARESAIAALAGPVALWGRVNHWAPLRLARSVAERGSHTPDEPAMRTIVAGTVLVLGFYALQTTLVALGAGWLAALVYGMSLPACATWDIEYADRRRRAIQRVRTYLRFRRTPMLQQRLISDLAWLRHEAAELSRAVGGTRA